MARHLLEAMEGVKQALADKLVTWSEAGGKWGGRGSAKQRLRPGLGLHPALLPENMSQLEPVTSQPPGEGADSGLRQRWVPLTHTPSRLDFSLCCSVSGLQNRQGRVSSMHRLDKWQRSGRRGCQKPCLWPHLLDLGVLIWEGRW